MIYFVIPIVSNNHELLFITREDGGPIRPTTTSPALSNLRGVWKARTQIPSPNLRYVQIQNPIFLQTSQFTQNPRPFISLIFSLHKFWLISSSIGAPTNSCSNSTNPNTRPKVASFRLDLMQIYTQHIALDNAHSLFFGWERVTMSLGLWKLAVIGD